MPREPADQLAAKVVRTAGLLGREPDRVHPSPRALGYRARITLRRGPSGAWSFTRPRSHDRVPVTTCATARPELQTALAALPPVQGARSVELRTDGDRVVLTFEGGRRDALEALEGPWSGVARADRTVSGETDLYLEVAGIRHLLGPTTFFQVNLEVNEALVAAVSRAVHALEPEAVLELYSGAGNLGLPLAATGVRVTSVESHPEAVTDARRTAAAAGLCPTLIQRDVVRLRAGEHAFDVLLLDPPRAGAPGVLPELALTRPRGIVYVSCDARALARDLKPLRGGYDIARLELFDMFPQTPHAEVLCVLHRR